MPFTDDPLARITPRILVIAGSDSGGGAGVQADIKTISALGGHAMTAMTAVTAQDTLQVHAVHLIPPAIVRAQIDAVAGDIGIDAVKIGMLGSPETAAAVADWLEGVDVPVVFDPVMVASSGDSLADAATIAAFERVAARATLVTPNTPELERLSGVSVSDEISLQDAADAFMRRTGCDAVLAKGGHLTLGGFTYGSDANGTPYRYENTTRVFDFLYAGSPANWQEWNWDSPKIDTRHTHGTGCTLASAIAVGLARGEPLADAIARARRFVHAALLAAPGFGQGHGPMGQQAVREF